MNLNELYEKARAKWRDLAESRVPVIYLGTASCGRASGAMQTLEAIQKTLAEDHIDARVVQVGCIGPCYLEPLMDIALPGMPRVSYAKVTPRKARTILESVLLKGDFISKLAVGYLGTEGIPPAGIPAFFDHPMLKPQARVVLRNCGLIDPEDIDQYLAQDGYQGLARAFELGPEGVIAEVKSSGLRGRGGAGFLTFKKWEICLASPAAEKYLICNADEGDPGAFMNRSLIEGDPHAVLEGLLIAAYAVGATHGYIYIRAEYPLAIARLRTALSQLHQYGLLGENILGSGFNFEITIKEGAGAYVCGEETALMASIEGKRGMPRSRPPFPAVAGLFGKPTVINNTETLGTLPNILRNGGAWYQGFGKNGNVGTKTFSLVGKVRRTGLIEVPLGTTLREIIFDVGGGTAKPFKAVQTGGPSGGCLSEEFLDLPVGYESLQQVGSIMGSGGLIVLDQDSCVVDLAHYFLCFTQKESCGKCVPCRVGTGHMAGLLDKITRGDGSLEDLDKLEALSQTVQKASLCGLGQNAPNPVMTTLRYFRDEYLAHVETHYCQASVCKDLFEFWIDPEKCNGCGRCRQVCPAAAIHGEKKQVHTLDVAACTRCRSCYLECSFDAIVGREVQPV
jgi:NADH-quinone oxidoreductase subunit F